MLMRILPWIIKGGVSVALIGWVLSSADLNAVRDHASRLDWQTVALSIVLMQIQVGVGAIRWGLVVRALSAVLPWTRTFGVYYISVFFAIVLPGAVGGDAVRMWFSRKSGLSLASSINSVLLERVMTVLALIVLVCLTQPILRDHSPDLPTPWLFQGLLLVACLGIVVLSCLDRLPHHWRRWPVVAAAGQIAADTRILCLRSKGGWGLSVLVIALFGHINLALAVYVLADGLGLAVTVLNCLVLVPPVILVMTLPISISGWGVRETAMVTAFGFIGVAHEQSLVLSILFGVITMVSALPGGVIFLFMRQRKDGAEQAPPASTNIGPTNISSE